MKLNTRILTAIEDGDLPTFSELVGHDESLRNGANAFGSWLHVASSEGQMPIVRYLVDNGADVNLKGSTFNAGPICHAVSAGHLEVVKYLIAEGAELDVMAPERNPLFDTVCGGHADIARFLLEAGIDPHITYRSVSGKLKNALSFAEEYDQTEIVNLLQQAGCRLPVDESDAQPVAETTDDQARSEIIAHFTQQFGAPDDRSLQEIVPVHDNVHVSIHVIRPSATLPLYTLFTTGMCHRAMTVPAGQESYQYAELLMHLPMEWLLPDDLTNLSETQLWPFTWLRQVAYYPHQNQTWLGGQTTIISSAEPPQPLGPNTKQTCLLLSTDFADWTSLTLADGRTVKFYRMLPIYTEERDYEKQHGAKALFDLFEQRGVKSVVNVRRRNVAVE